MQELLRALAELRGIAVEPGTDLRLELSAFPSGGLALLVLAALAALVVAIAAIYRRDGRNLGRGARATLAALRSLAVLAAALLLLEPDLVAVKKEERPGHAILLLDASQSMSQKDAFRRDAVADLREAWRRLGVQEPAAATRFELAVALLTAQDHAVVRELARRNKLHAYSFAAGIEPIALGTDATAAPLELGALAPAGRASDLGGAVRAALERSRDAAVAAVVLLTDGRRNAGPQGAEVARWLSQRKVGRALVLGIGDPSETQLVQLAGVDAPEKVFQRDPFRVRARVLAQGYDATAVSVRLLRDAAGGGSQPVQDAMVQVGGDATDVVVEFDRVIADEPGTFTYRVELQPPAGEAASAARHSAQAQVEVLSEQTRVLLIAGGPSHEYRFLQVALTRDKTIEVRCWLQSADPNFPQDGDVSIQALPLDHKEMDEIDVVVLVDPDPKKLTREFCQLAADHVLEGGGGLWWVGGEKFTLDALRGGAATQPLAELLPVVPDLVRADREIVQFGHGFARPLPWQLTPAGRDDKLTKLLDGAEANAALWARVPGYHFAFPVVRAKPGATALAESASPAFGHSGETAPLLAYQLVGSGRVLYTGTDETYRWRALFEEAYQRLWVKGIRFLFEGRLSAGNSRLRLRRSEEKVELGEAVKVSASARDEALQPLSAGALELRFERQGGDAEAIRLEPVAESPGQYEGVVRPKLAGFYRLAPTAPFGRPVELWLQVETAALEREGPVDLVELEAIASAPGGELLRSPQQLLEAVQHIPSLRATDTFRTAHPVWDTWVTIAVVLSLLSAEWWLRKRSNLL